MIHEFAVDPEALAGWQNFRFLVSHFGVPHGRLISRFPKEWKRMVYEACSVCPDVEKKKIELALERIDAKVFVSGRTYDRSQKWVPNAVTSHAERPFQAIITTANKAKASGLLDVEQLSETEQRWATSRGKTMFRTAANIAEAAETLFHCSSEVLLIDPHYSGTARYGKPLELLIRCACAGTPLKRFEYHLAAKEIPGDFFRGDLEGQRPYLKIPVGHKLVFVRWRQIDDSEGMHPRYVLTERGGIRIEHGLDEGEPGDTSDVECLPESIYSQRWAQFHPDAGVYQLVDAWIMTAEMVVPACWKNGQFAEVA